MNEYKVEISIIVPVYNVEQYLSRCIDSILQQSFEDYEIILVNDGSKDNSGQICNDYVQKDSRIKIINQENAGLAISRRNGFRKSNGKYIMFVDSDDWIDKDTLKDMYKRAEENESEIVCMQFRRVNEKGRKKDYGFKFDPIICEKKEDMVYHMHTTRYISSSACTKLIRRDIMDSISFPINLAIGEEHNMVAQLILNADRVIIVDDIYYNYFFRSNSISHSGYNSKYDYSLDNYIEIENKFENMFPSYKTSLRSFYAEYEMAVVTAMCRNSVYNWNTIKKLRSVLTHGMKDILISRNTAVYFKISAFLIAYFPHIFIVLFRIVHLITGR